MNNSGTEITLNEAADFALKYYGIIGELKRLDGEEDANFYMKDEAGREFAIKISRPDKERHSIEMQIALMKFLLHSEIALKHPEIILSKDGEEFILLDDRRVLRVQKWVPGRMISKLNPRTPGFLESWGKACGLLSLHLKDFDHPAAHRFYKWNPSETLYSRKFRQYFKEDEELEIADYFWNLFEADALEKIPALRKSVNYNDAHEHNFLTDNNPDNPLVNGLIDFGDILYTETINELAIACAYSGMYFPDPLEAMKHTVMGYHKEFSIREEELEVLYHLIYARLMITVASAAWNKHREPENPYLLISEKPAWDLLKKLRVISPSVAHYTFRKACGMEPCNTHKIYKQWLQAHQNEIGPVIFTEQQSFRPIDLSMGSMDLGNNSNFADLESFQASIDRMLAGKGGGIGIGGYGEIRPFYSSDAYQSEGNSGAQWRTVHLGLDFWAGPETPVLAPLHGVVYSIRNNVGDRNYGPTLILAHRVSSTLEFYTLYGHLSWTSISGFKKGDSVQKGQAIASIGGPEENGKWPAHLHFQIILDMLGNDGDFPGVAFPDDMKTWLSISPDPYQFLTSGLDLADIKSSSDSSRKESLLNSGSADKILSARKSILGKSLSVSYNNPLHMVRAYMQYLYDSSGRRYLDTVNNVPHVGHQHPRVVEAAVAQIGVLNTNTRYLHEDIVRYAEELLETFPPELSVVHFVNSGSEANELGLRMVEAASGQKDMIAVEVGYHGNTTGCIDISSYKFDGKGGKGAPKHTQVVPIPDQYRGLYRSVDHSGNLSEEEAGKKYASHVGDAITRIQAQGRGVGGFICESIMSCGGQVVLPAGYLKEAYRYIRTAGGLCIADEVQVGFGRVGETFWGFELQDVVPDIVTLGKPMGNGHPLAAVVTTRAVADAFANGMEYFNTFGGNPVSCAIGREVLQVVKDEDLQGHALATGSYLNKGLRELQSRYPIIGDVRGHGLFLGFELVEDLSTIEPATQKASYLANRMRERSILMSVDGPFNNVLKIKPPMCFNLQDADFLLENLDRVLGEDFMRYFPS